MNYRERMDVEAEREAEAEIKLARMTMTCQLGNPAVSNHNHIMHQWYDEGDVCQREDAYRIWEDSR